MQAIDKNGIQLLRRIFNFLKILKIHLELAWYSINGYPRVDTEFEKRKKLLRTR